MVEFAAQVQEVLVVEFRDLGLRLRVGGDDFAQLFLAGRVEVARAEGREVFVWRALDEVAELVESGQVLGPGGLGEVEEDAFFRIACDKVQEELAFLNFRFAHHRFLLTLITELRSVFSLFLVSLIYYKKKLSSDFSIFEHGWLITEIPVESMYFCLFLRPKLWEGVHKYYFVSQRSRSLSKITNINA